MIVTIVKIILCLYLKGQILTFLDAHIEVTEGWLIPLLARIVEDRSTVVCPYIDALSIYDLSYVRQKFTWIGFHWAMNMDW